MQKTVSKLKNAAMGFARMRFSDNKDSPRPATSWCSPVVCRSAAHASVIACKWTLVAVVHRTVVKARATTFGFHFEDGSLALIWALPIASRSAADASVIARERALVAIVHLSVVVARATTFGFHFEDGSLALIWALPIAPRNAADASVIVREWALVAIMHRAVVIARAHIRWWGRRRRGSLALIWALPIAPRSAADAAVIVREWAIVAIMHRAVVIARAHIRWWG